MQAEAMPRTATLFAIASVALLVTGLLMPDAVPHAGIVVPRPHITAGHPSVVAYPLRVSCYCLATLFAVFAFAHSIAFIPYSRGLTHWHFWLSLGCVVWLAVGYTALGIVGSRQTSSQPFGPFATVLAFSFLATVPVFVATQLWFVIDLIRALLTMRAP